MPQQGANRPRRKAKQERARATVEVVLEAAARVLAQRGYASASTNRIAEAAGVSVGTVYEYFANKEEIFEAVIQRELHAIIDAVRGHVADASAPVEAILGRILAAAMAAMRFGPELFRVLEQVPDASFRRQLADARALVVAQIRRLLEEHRAELRVTDLDLAAFVVVSAAEGIGGNATQELFDRGLAAELESLLRAYLTGR